MGRNAEREVRKWLHSCSELLQVAYKAEMKGSSLATTIGEPYHLPPPPAPAQACCSARGPPIICSSLAPHNSAGERPACFINVTRGTLNIRDRHVSRSNRQNALLQLSRTAQAIRAKLRLQPGHWLRLNTNVVSTEPRKRGQRASGWIERVCSRRLARLKLLRLTSLPPKLPYQYSALTRLATLS